MTKIKTMHACVKALNRLNWLAMSVEQPRCREAILMIADDLKAAIDADVAAAKAAGNASKIKMEQPS